MNIIGSTVRLTSHSLSLSLFLFFSASFGIPECFFYFGNHIETPYVSGLSTGTPDPVCNGNSRHRGKKKGKKERKKKTLRMASKRESGRGGESEQPSITSLFTDFSTGAMWIFVITEPKAATVSFYSRFANDDF